MKITRRYQDGVDILELVGRFVVSSGETEVLPLRSAITQLIAEGRLSIALNLAALASIDARGLGELVFAFTTLHRRGGKLTLIAPTPTLRKLLAITRLDKVLPICESEREATSGIRRAAPRFDHGLVAGSRSRHVTAPALEAV